MQISPSPSNSGIVAETAATESEAANSWGPYASSADFKGNALMILSIVFCAVLLFLAFNSIIRFLLCANCCPSSNSNPTDEEEDPEKRKSGMHACAAAAPETTMVFSKEMGTAECAICLSEFVEGDGIRVLPACNHVFHVKCLEKWLALRCSCPTCRKLGCHPSCRLFWRLMVLQALSLAHTDPIYVVGSLSPGSN